MNMKARVLVGVSSVSSLVLAVAMIPAGAVECPPGAPASVCTQLETITQGPGAVDLSTMSVTQLSAYLAQLTPEQVAALAPQAMAMLSGDQIANLAPGAISR
ncbi:MAG: hypothetical protein PSX37_01750, partial [bacterium]|nr:hypothetical protein [bacterium]